MATDTIFFDFSKKGKDLLGTKDIPVLSNDAAVKESIINLLSTNIGARIMNPLYGVNIEKYLFEPFDDITSNSIKYEIQNGIERFEDRVTDLLIEIIPNEMMLSYEVNIDYTVVYTNTSDTIQLKFNKVR